MLKYLKLPHVTKAPPGWRRRALIILCMPQECIRAIYLTYLCAKRWW